MQDGTNLEITPAWFATYFRHVWKNKIAREYEAGALNSEAALQAHLVGALSVLAPEVVTFVEPRLSRHEAIPDLWVCRSQSLKAIAVIEIKFVPHDYPVWEKDMDKLVKIIGDPECATFPIDPVSGKYRKDAQLTCDNGTLGIFAVVGQHDGPSVSSARLAERLHVPDARQEPSHPLHRVLHAWGTVDSGQGVRAFDAGWLTTR